MNCDIIKDLIPLCGEGLCSEKSEKEIREHIKECEGCRILYESMPVTKDDTPKFPDEKNIFKKVNKRLKRHRIIDIILLLIVSAIICGLGYLTFGQIAKTYDCQSFETIFQSLEVRKLGKYIAEGDFESYVDYVTDGHIGDIFTYSLIDEIKQSDIKMLEKVFEETYGDTKPVDIKVKSYYGQMHAEKSVTIYSTLTITFENGKEFTTDFLKDVDGLYRANGMNFVSDSTFDKQEEFSNAINFSSWHENYPLGVVETLMKSNKPTKNMLLNKFHTEYQEDMKAARDSFLEKGFTVDNFFFSRYRFDEEKNMFYYDVSLDASDSKGTAQLRTRIYYDHIGLHAPDKDTIQIYSNSCTPELEEALANYFG